MNAELDRLPDMLARLGLKATRDRLDNLLDEAGRRDLSLREALSLVCTAEVTHREQRRISMGLGIAGAEQKNSRKQEDRMPSLQIP